jgi:hypothetical protein
MKKRRLLLGIGALGLCLAAVLALGILSAIPTEAEDRFHLIHLGQTKADAEASLGGPGQPYTYLTESGRLGWRLYSFGDESAVAVRYTPAGRVIATGIIRPGEDDTFTERVGRLFCRLLPW